MADVHKSGRQPQDAVQLHLGPGLLQRIIGASEKGPCPTLRLENAGGVLTVGSSQYRLEVEADLGTTVVRVPDGNAHTSDGSLATIRQKLRVQDAATAEVPKQKAAVQQPQSQLAAPLESGPLPDKEQQSHSKAPTRKAPASEPASGALRAKSGSPPPWAHLVGQNAVFRPALGNREPTPPAASVPTPKSTAAPDSHSTASAKPPSGQHGKAAPSSVSQVQKNAPELAQAALQKPIKVKGAQASSRKGTPEPRLQSQQAPKHAADSSRKAQPRQQQIPQHLSVRSQTGTPEPPSQAPKQLTGQPMAPPKQSGKPPLRPSPGSSRDPTPDIAGPASRGGTPDSVNVSSSSGPSNPNTSRDATPQPGIAGQPLSRPSLLSRPGSAPALPGATTQAGNGAPVKAVKKPRKLLGKKGAAKKKAGQGADEGREMDIPAAALIGARKGLIYCLVGLISHRRYSSKSLTKAVAEAARRVETMRNPSSEVLREQALKIAQYKSPGMWVLMDSYQKFADELKAEADQAASPDQAAPAMSSGASPEPEAPPPKQRPRSKPTTGRSPAADQSRANTYLAEQPPVLVMPQQHKLPRKRKDASVHDKTVEISDTESEGQRFKRRANTSKPSAARDAAASKPAPAPSQRPAQPSEQPLDSSRQPFERQPHAIRSEPMAPARSPKPLQASEQPAYSGGGPSAVAEAAHLRPTPSPSPRPPGHKGPAKPGREDSATPHSTSMRGSPSPPQLSRPQTPSELQTSHEADDTWYAEHSRREPVRHAFVESSEQYARYVEEYDAKHEAYLQIHQAIRRTQRYVSAIEVGYQAAKTKHEEDWYNQQADRLGRRVEPLMQHWCSAYKVLHVELQDIKERLEEYHQLCASEDAMAD